MNLNELMQQSKNYIVTNSYPIKIRLIKGDKCEKCGKVKNMMTPEFGNLSPDVLTDMGMTQVQEREICRGC